MTAGGALFHLTFGTRVGRGRPRFGIECRIGHTTAALAGRYGSRQVRRMAERAPLRAAQCGAAAARDGARL
ncbi:hypothetical protein BN2476_630029 [Paraburkholderia piptadeniae]|uniref:Uncharacterized protein n=1 Tax=Paraburkholderia piptadeniae TaxID=1701573 RepID=A0A1N7SL60_9BURK|nr:hypothetical protein BN2476_630029 [Paraburkholderia piptadeniae]